MIRIIDDIMLDVLFEHLASYSQSMNPPPNGTRRGFAWIFNCTQGSRFRVHGPGFAVQGPGFRVYGSGFTVQGLRFRVYGAGLNWTLRDGVQQVAGRGLRVQGVGLVELNPEGKGLMT